MRFGFFLQEALRGLGRNSAPALAALLTVVLTALVLGVFIPIVQATTGTANSVRDRVVVDVYLKDGSTAAERQEIKTALDRTANVKSASFISKAQGLAEAKKKNPEAFGEGTALLGGNPLPDAFRVVPEDPGRVQQIVNRLAPRDAQGRRTPSLAGIDEVRNKEEDTQKILSATGLVKILTAGLAALLVFASIALIANTIRLSIFARRREVEVMKLVGATNWFIRWPFMLEGAIVGLMGGVVAILLLLVAKITFVDPIEDRFALLASPNTINFGVLIAILMICCVGVSSAGSALTLRRFLRV
jgi:cell division transport system permease protein